MRQLSQFRQARNSRRPAFTLVELLIVVAIALVMMAGAIPLLRSTVQDNKVRESSRMVDMYMVSAQAQAIESGRPVGVWIERGNVNFATGTGILQFANQSSQLFIAETPLPYAGDIVDAKTYGLTDSSLTPNGITKIGYFALKTCGLMSTLVHQGDLIRFNNQGAWYVIRSISSSPVTYSGEQCWQIWFHHPDTQFGAGADGQPGKVSVDDDGDGNVDNASELGWPDTDDVWNSPVGGPLSVVANQPFQVLRQPIRSSTTSLELPLGATIDLRFSGMGSEGFEFAAQNADDKSPVVIMFSPNGNVDRVIYGGKNHAATGTIHILVGRNDGMIDADTNIPTAPNPLPWRNGPPNSTITYDLNLANRSSLWVAVAHRNGTTGTYENLWELTPDELAANNVTIDASLRTSRTYSHRGQAMGGH